MKRLGVAFRSFVAAAFLAAPSIVTPVQAEQSAPAPNTFCARTRLCADLAESEQLGYYTGHDEPSLLFYSNREGAGNDMVYRIQLPKDPPVQPNDAGTGGTWNFQLRPAFWFGMAMCDTTSAPEFTNQCTPNTDANIFDDGNPDSPHYIGKHPGTAFMELQFYPPSWVKWPAAEANAGGSSCDAQRWCVALNVDSLLQDQNTADPKLVLNNADCNSRAGIETINFAFLTKNGRSIAPADPLIAFAGIGRVASPTFTPDPQRVAFFNSGDTLEVSLHDTSGGLQTIVHDLDTGATGSMTAGPENGFAHLLFQPTAAKCTSEPYAFHPMYATSGEHTRVPWAAHSYNIAFSDEIGHFEYCQDVDNPSIVAGTGVCDTGDPKNPEPDNTFCFSRDMSSLVRVDGCTNSDDEFDGPGYARNWPGTDPNRAQDARLHAQPVRFTSALIRGKRNFQRIAFETDLPRIEGTQGCNRVTGAGCTNPPAGASFYPFFTSGRANLDRRDRGDDRDDNGGDRDSARRDNDGRLQGCVWREGGAFLPNTRPGNFTSSSEEYGPLLLLTYPGPGFQPFQRFNDYRRILPFNPCRAHAEEGDD